MPNLTRLVLIAEFAAWLAMITPAQEVLAHGGVVAGEDLCVIEIGIFRAHFTIYQPETRASNEYCESIPDLGNAVFVLDYLHNSLKEVPVDFRIIKDVNNRTIYANWEDISSIEDLESVTVFYQSPQIFPDASMSISHEFSGRGWYTGIVTTRHPTRDHAYQAVFGFHVGRKDIGIWPLMILIALAVQGYYWVSSGGYRRWREARNNRS